MTIVPFKTTFCLRKSTFEKHILMPNSVWSVDTGDSLSRTQRENLSFKDLGCPLSLPKLLALVDEKASDTGRNG